MTQEDVRGSEKLEIDPYERNWIRFSIVLLIVFAAAVTIAGFALGFQVPGEESRVDPQTLSEPGSPFAEPGLREVAPGEYDLYMVAQIFSFSPGLIEVPVGSTINFYVTSSDVQHGLKVQDTNINVQVVPGEVSKLTATFDEIGEYPFICTEYCGQGHANMFGTLRVVQETGGGS